MPNDIPRFDDWVKSPRPRRSLAGADKLVGVQPELKTHLENLQAELDQAGVRPIVRSGFRTAEQQNALHRAGKPTKGNDGFIKISPHQEGRAVDLGNLGARGARIVRDYARRNNLHVPRDEPWHLAIPKTSAQPQQQIPAFDDWVSQFEDTQTRVEPITRSQSTTQASTRFGTPQPNTSSATRFGARPRPARAFELSRLVRGKAQAQRPVSIGPGRESTVNVSSDTLRVMKGEQPLDRVAYQREGDLISRLPEEPYRDRVLREQQEVSWRKTNQPEIERQTKLYKQDIRKAKNLGGDANQWIAEFGTKAASGLTEFGAGLTGSDTLRIKAEAAQRAAQEEGADRNVVSKFVQDIGAGFIGSAPELAAMSLGAPPVITFGVGGGIRARGRGESVAGGTGHGLATGLAFEVPGVGQGAKGVLSRAGGVGATSAGVELATGASPQEALTTGLVNAAMVGAPELVRGGRRARQVESKSTSDTGKVAETVAPPRGASVETREVNPTTESAEVLRNAGIGRSISPLRSVEDARQAETQPPQRFQHIQFGEVEVLPDQSGAGRGRLKVAEVNNPDAIHFVKKASQLGRGNERMIPLKEVPPEATVEPSVAAREGVERSAPLPLNEAKPSRDVSTESRKVDRPAIAGEELAGMAKDRRAERPELLAENVPSPQTARPSKYYRGFNADRGTGADQFYSSEREVAQEYAAPMKVNGKPGTVEEVSPERIPSNLYEASNKEALKDELGVPAAPYSAEFDAQVKSALQTKGYEGVRYLNGTFDAEEIHVFGPSKTELTRNEAVSQQFSTPIVREAARPPEGRESVRSETVIPIKEVNRATMNESGTTQSDVSSTGKDAGGERTLAPEPSITSARKEMFKTDRAELDLPELPPAERKAWQKTLDEAKAKGTQNASVLADEVLAKPRALNDVETGQLVLRAQEIKNEHSRVMKEIGEAVDPDTISTRREQADALQRAFDKITEATKKSGTEKGRALASQKLTINQDFDLVSVLQRAKAAKGKELTAGERAKFETQTKQIEELQTKLARAEADALSRSIQKDIEKIRKQTKRSEKKQAIDEEFVFLKTEFAQARMEAKGVQASGLAGLDPEGKLTPIILKMARNRVKAGIVEAEAVVDHVYQAVREHVEDASRDDIRKLLAQHNLEHDPLPAIKTRLAKQEKELTRRIEEKDYAPPPKRKPVVYDREASNLKARVEQLKRKIEADIKGKDSKLETVLAMRKAGMLTGIRTHLRNIGGNTAFQVSEEVSRMPGALADLLVSTVTKRRALGMPNPVDVAKSSYAAATRGVREAVQTIRFGATAEELAKLERPRELNSGSKIVDAYVNTVFRTLGAEDKVFRTYAYERSILEQKRLRKTDTVTPEMEAQAILDAEVATFNNENQLAKGVEFIRNRSGKIGSTAIDLVVPFRRTPANIATRLLESTPLGALKAGGQLFKAALNKKMSFEDQRKFSQTVGRSVTGSSLIALGYWLASQGLATGLTEDDAGDREIQKASGRSPLAIRVGDLWHQIGAFSPLGNLIAIGAALHREQTRPLKEGEERGNIVTAALPVAGKVMLEQPFLRGASGVVEALDNPGRAGSAFVGQTVGSFVPTLASDVGAAVDNKRRYGRTMSQRVEARIPILRSRVPEEVDVFGRPLQSRRTAMIDPTLTSKADESPLIKELVRLDVGIPKANRKPGETDEQLRARQIKQGNELERVLSQLVGQRGYVALKDEEKIDALKDAIAKIRKSVNAGLNPAGRQPRTPRHPRLPIQLTR